MFSLTGCSLQESPHSPVAVPASSFCWDQPKQGGSESATVVVVARPSSPQTPGHFEFLTVCGSTSLVGSKCGDNSSKDQSRANGRRHCQIRFSHFNPLLTSLTTVRIWI